MVACICDCAVAGYRMNEILSTVEDEFGVDFANAGEKTDRLVKAIAEVNNRTKRSLSLRLRQEIQEVLRQVKDLEQHATWERRVGEVVRRVIDDLTTFDE